MRLERVLKKSAELPVPRALDHRVRAALRTMPLAPQAFALPVMALGLAIAATLAMTVSMALSFASAGAGESGVSIAALLVVGYLGISCLIALPLLLKLKAIRPNLGSVA
jgi:hypothetical protein